MPPLSSRRKRLVGLCFWFEAILSVAGCYSPEASWKVCCALVISDEKSNIDARKTIIDWQSWTSFSGDGSAADTMDLGSLETTWKSRQLRSEIRLFLTGNPGTRPSDYFVGLGMTCRSIDRPAADVTRCQIDLPVLVECVSLNVYFPWGAPIPKELQRPIPALLHVRVDVSTSALLDTFTRVLPIPGGRLCHR